MSTRSRKPKQVVSNNHSLYHCYVFILLNVSRFHSFVFKCDVIWCRIFFNFILSYCVLSLPLLICFFLYLVIKKQAKHKSVYIVVIFIIFVWCIKSIWKDIKWSQFAIVQSVEWNETHDAWSLCAYVSISYLCVVVVIVFRIARENPFVNESKSTVHSVFEIFWNFRQWKQKQFRY